jgi:hypothetical protein
MFTFWVPTAAVNAELSAAALRVPCMRHTCTLDPFMLDRFTRLPPERTCTPSRLPLTGF